MKTKIHILAILFAFAGLTASAAGYPNIDSIHVVNSTSCKVCNGTATAYPSGGFPPYTYYWSNGGSTKTVTGLCPGYYYLVVQDSHGDTTASFCNVGPASMFATDSATNTCSNTGTASTIVFGGTAPYTYAWSNGATTSSISGLTAGTYVDYITDAGGCSTADTVTVGSGLSFSLSEVDATCFNSSNGSATVYGITGGTAPFTYSWSPSGQTKATATGLSAGTYSVTVKDKNGCAYTDSIFVGSPYPISFDTLTFITGSACSSNTGSASVNAYGGTPSYTYLWSPSGQTSSSATGLSAGTYFVTVTDASGCTGLDTIIIPSVGPIPTIAIVNDSCYGQCNGTASVTGVTGGTGPYTYSWAPGGATTTSITGLCAGTYTLTVTDHTGCTGTTSVSILQPGMLTAVVDTVPDTGSCAGAALVIVSGGTGPYTYTWSTVVSVAYDSLGNYEVDSLCFGTYFMCVTDAHGCSTCDSVHIRHAPHKILGIDNIEQGNQGFTLYPNPSNGQFRVSLVGMTQNQNAEIAITNLLGEVVYKTSVETTGNTFNKDISMQNAPAGLYFVRVTTANKVYTSKLVIGK